MIEDRGESWELLGVRQLAAEDEHAQAFLGTLLVDRGRGSEPVEVIPIRARRAVLEELQRYLTRLLDRSRGLKSRPP
jgi:hypothetical protein